SSPVVTPYALPVSQSSDVLDISRPISLQNTSGEINRPVKMLSPNQDISLEIDAGTKITTADGKAFTGVLSTPRLVPSTDRPQSPSNLKPVLVIEIGDQNGNFLHFSKPYKLSLPIPKGSDPQDLKIYYYDVQAKEYKLVGDGGKIEGDFITVWVDHMTMFALINPQDKANTTTNSGIFVKFFKDSKNHWAKSYIADLYDAQIIDKNTNFSPNRTANRAEVAKMITLAFNLPMTKDLVSPFKDVPANHWSAAYVNTLKKAGIVKGYSDGNFKPNQTINRAEAVKMVTLAAKLSPKRGSSKFQDVANEAWYTSYINIAYEKGIVSGKTPTKFEPASPITRGEMAKIISITRKLK
ncbi:MAG TPA: S-layer homology domain-containing protein, partial [Candidatus Gracilibacteria bacterium]|nr:S-layer homology domain-containing protein [Candidatus Gracilibacteria bacterium]